MRKLVFLFLLFISVFCLAQQKVVFDSNYGKHLEKTVIFKIKPEFKSKCGIDNIDDEKIQTLFNQISVKSQKKKYPFSKLAKFGNNIVDISTIYEIQFNADVPLEKVISSLQQNSNIEYAVPHNVVNPLYTPNDPNWSSQYYLTKIKAFEAWDICKGDSNVVIAISDWGADNNHVDLINKVAYNRNDPFDGIDNDNDGYIDNFRGWNFGENNNNPQAGTGHHGIWTSGIAAAETDNNIGMAGVSFNCRFLPIKISNAQEQGVGAYESIVYAADHGASIVNCSWGDTSNSNAYGQDIINYATAKNMLVVAASGNSITQRPFYPASYEHVMSVTGTNQSDHIATWTYDSGVTNHEATCGIYVDIAAPCAFIYTTNINNSYWFPSYGTSFAAPIVSGCAALVKSCHPNYNAEQIREILKVTADIIDTIPGNSKYAGLTGSGRVNLYRALTDPLPPSVIYHTYKITDNNDNWLTLNDTVKIKGLFTNYLTSSTNLTVSLSSTSSSIQIINGVINLGVIGTMDTVSNNSNPFKFKIKSDMPYDTPVRLKLTFSDLAHKYKAIQWIEFVAKKSWADINPNNISTTITANGNIGYNDSHQLNGISFRFKNSDPLIWDAGLMFGNADNKVSTCVRQSNNFAVQSIVKRASPSLFSNEDYQASFTDNLSSSPFNVKVEQNIYAWHSDSAADFIIAEYGFINNSQEPVIGMYAGIFADWDIANSRANKVNYHAALNFSYTYSNDPDGIYSGMKLLSGQPEKHYAIENKTGGDGFVDISQGFSTTQKYYVLSHTHHTAGLSGSGNDVCDVMSAGPFDIGVHDTVKVAFALMAGENQYVIQNAAVAAQLKYDSIYNTTNVTIIENKNFGFNVSPNPVLNKVQLIFSSKISDKTEIFIYDVFGRLIDKLKITESFKNYDCANLIEGIYFIKVITDKFSRTKKFVIAR